MARRVFGMLAGCVTLVSGCIGIEGVDDPSAGLQDELKQGKPYEVALKDVSLVSAPSPFAGTSCAGATGNAHYEWTATVAVDPKDSRHVVAAWVQDEALGVVTAVSRDGGTSWARSTVPSLTTCTGGKLAQAFRPRLAIGGNGIVYLAAVLQQGAYDPANPLSAVDSAIGAVVVSRSEDGGASWAEPVYMFDPEQGGFLNHVDTLTAEPDDPDAASLVWSKRSTQDVTFISRTTDGGRTWSSLPARLSPPGHLSFSEVAALPDGTLVLVVNDDSSFGGSLPSPLPGTISVLRSTDKGKTWSLGAQLDSGVAREHADTAVGPDGRLHVSWRRLADDGSSTVVVRSSSDSGATFGPAQEVAVLPAGPLLPPPALAVAEDGTLGLLFGDSRNDVAEDEGTDVDVWLRHSKDGSSWSETYVSSFLLDEIPYNDVGPYQGLDGADCGFRGVFVQGAPHAASGPTDVFMASFGINGKASGRCKNWK